MIPSKQLKTVGLVPWGRFVTTYSSDYQPIERHTLAEQRKARSEAKAAAAFINPLTDGETWPIFLQYFYKTTNSIYGSSSQPPSSSFSPASSPPFGFLTPFVSTASGGAGSSPTQSWTQEEGVARETGSLLDEEEEGQLHYIFSGNDTVLEQQQKVDVLYEEGVIVLSSHVGPSCCKDFLRSVCREAGLQHTLHPSVASSPVTIRDAENWDSSSCLRGLRSIGLKNPSFPQPTSRQCSCCVWDTECPCSCCFRMQTLSPGIPHGSTLPLARAQPTVYCTEYQARYTTEWVQPKIQQSDFHRHHPGHQQILYPSV